MQNEEIQATTIEDLELGELGRLYGELGEADPGSEKYNSILNEITKIRQSYNEGNKYWSSREALEQERELKEKTLRNDKTDMIVKTVMSGINIITTSALAWVTLKYGIKFGPISSRDAWQMIFRKKN